MSERCALHYFCSIYSNKSGTIIIMSCIDTSYFDKRHVELLSPKKRMQSNYTNLIVFKKSVECAVSVVV